MAAHIDRFIGEAAPKFKTVAKGLRPLLEANASAVTQTRDGRRDNGNVKALPDKLHWRLSITPTCFQEALRFIRFPYSDVFQEYCYVPGVYHRDDDAHPWIDKEYGDGVKKGNNASTGKFVGVGYDLLEHIRSWLKQHNAAHLSINEVLLVEAFEGVRLGPSIFFSHQQKLQVPQTMLKWLTGIADCPDDVVAGAPKVKFDFGRGRSSYDLHTWLDYTNLRQCQKDFSLEDVGEVIRQIGCTLVEMDSGLTYLDRSFCVLELFESTASENVQVVCQFPVTVEHAQAILAKKPVDIRRAATRDKEAMEKIRLGIQRRVGISQFNLSVTSAALEAARSTERQAARRLEQLPVLVTQLSSGTTAEQEQAAGALFNVAIIDDRHRDAITAAGGVPALVALLSSGTAAVREQAAGALRNVAAGDGRRKDAIVAAGGGPALRTAADSGCAVC